jgi:structural maintenance of chromosome 2
LNGSGKSNILDSICFVLGITNLSNVRATNLTELVYKSGQVCDFLGTCFALSVTHSDNCSLLQSRVTKASVTIVFDNHDKANSPVGFEACDEITVTRQVVVGGRNKYLINGVTAQTNRVQNLFHSVQLNVNNPHFLIMQGRITKVLNMKPPETLGMIEEAAGMWIL